MPLPKSSVNKARMIKSTDVLGIKVLKRVGVGLTSTTKKIQGIINDPKLKVKYKIKEFYSAKIYLKDKLGNRRKAKRVFLKPVFGFSYAEQKTSALRQARILNRLRKIGVPSPKAGALKYNGQYVIAVEPFLKNQGTESKLIPINSGFNRPEPTFLKHLNAQEHKELIKSLGKDLAQVTNIGLSTEHFDMHGFYKKQDGSFERVIMDSGHIMEQPFTREKVNFLLEQIKHEWPVSMAWPRLALFREGLITNIKSTQMRALFEKEFDRTFKK